MNEREEKDPNEQRIRRGSEEGGDQDPRRPLPIVLGFETPMK